MTKQIAQQIITFGGHTLESYMKYLISFGTAMHMMQSYLQCLLDMEIINAEEKRSIYFKWFRHLKRCQKQLELEELFN